MRNTIYSVFIFFVLFPYVSFFKTGTDLQPWGMLIALMLMTTFKVKFSKIDFLLGVIAVFSCVLFFLSDMDFIAMRSVSGYVGLFLISYTTFRVLKSQILDIEKIIKISAVTWLAVGLIQILFDKSFLSFLLPDFRTSNDRGVVGLAPEPSFFGVILIFFILYISHTKISNQNRYLALCIAGVVFLSQSSMAILILIIFFLLLSLIYINFFYVVCILLTISFLPVLASTIESESRVIYLLSTIASDPLLLLSLDASVNDRLFHILFSLKGAFENFLVPNGFSRWISYAENQVNIYSNIVIVESFSLWGRIMSGYGAVFFELGIFAIIIPLLLTKLYWDLYRDELKKFFFYALSVNLLMVSAIPIGFPLFAFYISYLRFLVWQKNNKQRKLAMPLVLAGGNPRSYSV
jgi:hypothetical protein